MMIVGLTGGMGSGKSTVSSFLKELGVPVYNSDIQAKKLMQSSKKLRNSIIELLGEASYLEGKLNRSYIAKAVFGNKVLLKKLNNIVHPTVRKHFLKWIKKQSAPYVVQETALLFENVAMDFYDKIILVTAPKDVRIERIVLRDTIDRESILARMDNQLEDTEKIKFSDFIIENVKLGDTKQKVEEINRALLEYC